MSRTETHVKRVSGNIYGIANIRMTEYHMYVSARLLVKIVRPNIMTKFEI